MIAFDLCHSLIDGYLHLVLQWWDGREAVLAATGSATMAIRLHYCCAHVMYRMTMVMKLHGQASMHVNELQSNQALICARRATRLLASD